MDEQLRTNFLPCQQKKYENSMHNQNAKNYQEINKSIENPLSSFSDDLDSLQSQTKITQNNLQQFSQNAINPSSCFQKLDNSSQSLKCSKISEEEYCMTHKTDNVMEIQVDYSLYDPNQKTDETENEENEQGYYYAVITLTTIVYGDITAKTTEERSVMIFLALLSCGIFGFTINSIGNILSDFKQKSDMHLIELGKLNKYLSHYQVSTQVQTNARKYLKFVHQEKNKDQLSTLQNFLKEETILQLSLQVQENIYQPEQIILGQNEVKEPAIYIINHGSVQKYSQYNLVAKENSIIELKEKENFGLIQFLSNKENSGFNFKSKELNTIFSLQLSSFLKIIKQDNESYEKFCYIRDQVIYQQYLSQVNFSCLQCQSKSHTLKECPYIFYNSRYVSITKNLLKQNKMHLKIKRSARKKQNSWKLFELNKAKKLDFYTDYINQLSFSECSQITEEELNENNEFQEPQHNYDIVISDVNKSHLSFKIPQRLKILKIKKKI
ncbi:hypothetical protein ABPG72_016305 [Tetrahymena utriculariae]